MMKIKDYNNAFAKYYDLINAKKDYYSETQEFDRILKKHIKKKKITMADVGCGTGNYTIEFNKLGYDVIGYDVSFPMIHIAKRKYENISFINTSFDKENKAFDVIISLFNVVNSLGNYDALLKFFISISKSMKAKSIFLFDMWNGIAVAKHPPQIKVKTIRKAEFKVIRKVIPSSTDLINQVSIMEYKMKIFKRSKLIEQLNPSLTSHFFMHNETIRALKLADLKIIKIFPADRFQDQVSENDWKINFLCKKNH